jgi:type IV secretion system protein VirB8
MEPLYKSLKEYIDSGEYFMDAQHWYKHKYIYPFSQRSFVFILSTIICALFIGIVVNIRGLFPVVIQVKYSINADTGANKAASITRANQVDDKPLASITDIMLRNYVTQREQYDYELLKKQFVYVKNNSTRIVFRRFYNYMNIDNSSSPVLRYQKDIKRRVVVKSSFITDTKAEIEFDAIAKDSADEIVEYTTWRATIEYEIDHINNNLPSGSRFNFTVTDYQLKLLADRKKK